MTLELLGFDPELLNLTQAIEIETYDMTEQLDNIEDYDNEERFESYDDAILEASDEEWSLCDC
jgi:hypothetical protein